MFERHSQAIYELVRDRALVKPAQLEAAREEHLASGRPIAAVLLDSRLLEKEELLRAVAASLDCDFLTEPPSAITPDCVASLPASLARDYGVIPLRGDPRGLDVLTVDPFNRQAVDDLTFATGRDVRLVVSDPAEVHALVRRYYGEDETALEDVLKEFGAAALPETSAHDLSAHDLEALAGQTPVVRFVNAVLARAVRDHASDVHFEPFETEFRIRYRIDGALHEITPPPKAFALPITSRIKVLAHLNIAERRLPQDGRIKVTLAGRAVDLRVSTLPTQFGESVVLRVLDQSAVQLDLAQLGMPPEVLAGVTATLRRPNGIFVVTGPTGSGKTTTLYSGLRLINTPDSKLLTAEDPVEYELDGIMQVPVNPPVGLTFASALRSFLRQDPDVIMVGEVRDLDTARVAIQASLTGHLVLSTLHTNDAAGAVTRLVDMGVEPFLIASTLEAVLAQRLVRRICPSCRAHYTPPHELLMQIGITPESSDAHRFFHGRGCDACAQTGYRGRFGIFEWLPITDEIRELILAQAPSLALRAKAIANGMRTLRAGALAAASAGETSLEEVLRHT